MTSKAEIEAGLLAHAKWKRRLRDAVKTGVSEFKPAVVRTEGACDFGKWLDSLSAEDRETADYQEVRQLHSEFHAKAAEILQLAVTGQPDKAGAQLEYDGAYGQTSGRLVLAMQRWEAKL